MNTPFNKKSTVVCFHKLSTFVNVLYETEGYETGDSKLLPLSVYHQWLENTGKLKADFSMTENGSTQYANCTMTIDDYWNDVHVDVIQADLREYYLALAAEDDDLAVDFMSPSIQKRA